MDVLGSELCYELPRRAAGPAASAFSMDARGNYAATLTDDGRLLLYDLAAARHNAHLPEVLRRTERDALLRDGGPVPAPLDADSESERGGGGVSPRPAAGRPAAKKTVPATRAPLASLGPNGNRGKRAWTNGRAAVGLDFIFELMQITWWSLSSFRVIS